MNKKFIITILIFSFVWCNPIIFAQKDYTKYYALTHKASLANKLGQREKVDSLLRKAFTLQQGFYSDYRLAFLNYYHQYHDIDTSFLKNAFKEGYKWMDFKNDAAQIGLKEYKSFKKLYRNNKPRHQKGSAKILGMLIRDQLSLSRHFRWLSWRNADSINAIKLNKLLIKDPELFNRNKSSWMSNQFLRILLVHQDNWKFFKPLFYKLRKIVKKGKMTPHVLQSMINRATLFHGRHFAIDTTRHRLIVKKDRLDTITKGYHYALLTSASLYGRFYRNGKFLLPPTAPNVTKIEINRLRKYLFMLPIDKAFPNKLFTPLTKKEFKKLLLQ